MATFLELRTQVIGLLIDAPTVVQASVPQLVNNAMRELQKKHNFKVMEKRFQVNTTAATRALGAMPADLKEFRLEANPYYVRQLAGARPLVWATEPSEPAMVWAPADTGAPQVLVPLEPTDDVGTYAIEVWPLPDDASDWSDGEYRIHIPYFRYLPALTADGSTNWFTVNADEFIVRKATALGFAADWDETRSTYWHALAEEKSQEAIRADKRYRVSNVNTLVPHWEGANASTLRF